MSPGLRNYHPQSPSRTPPCQKSNFPKNMSNIPRFSQSFKPTNFRLTVPMTTLSPSPKEPLFLLPPSITCLRPNLRPFTNILKRTSLKVSSADLNRLPAPRFCSSRKKTAPFASVSTIAASTKSQPQTAVPSLLFRKPLTNDQLGKCNWATWWLVDLCISILFVPCVHVIIAHPSLCFVIPSSQLPCTTLPFWFFTVNPTPNFRFRFPLFFFFLFFFVTPFTASNTINHTKQNTRNNTHHRLITANARKTQNPMDPTQGDRRQSSGQGELEGVQGETQSDY
ncbi:hypothetical protein K457DRAFT_368484 [Linnemannia elongata AG-77]|uniref:Uncharacterized protein n=1 Tax=Linnemannia elongata AG-77 TaxID=1314771 RepID=A0A197JCK2_9FUNG|nr:hypothetical protein K457DRAFT_368484 [Linnemannia elongata AG-77]